VVGTIAPAVWRECGIRKVQAGRKGFQEFNWAEEGREGPKGDICPNEPTRPPPLV
jgi:hypothetical protein